MATSKRHNSNLSEIPSRDPASLTKMETYKKVIIAGGGTGGHIYPAIGIAQALQQLDATVDITFIGGTRKLESTLVPQHGFHFLPISAAGFPRRLTLQWFPVIWKVCHGLTQSLRYIKELKPDIVIGTGGYVSGPVLFAALLRKIPIAIQEQNASVGLTNGILARWAKAAYLATESAQAGKTFRRTLYVEVTGNPIRPTIATFPRHKATYSQFGLSPERKTITVMGGSQGAQTINTATVAALQRLTQFADQIQIIHQTGKTHAEAIQGEYKKRIASRKASLLHCVRPFFENVEEIYSITDIIVCRAGGMTVAEVTACGIPAIFVPLPSQTGNDQVLNARTIADKGAAIVLEQEQLTVETLIEKITNILLDTNAYEQMATASRSLGKPQASDDIAKSILSHV